MSSLLDAPNTPDPNDHEHASNCVGCLDRRQMLKRAGLVTAGVAAAGVLAACGSGGGGGSTNDTPSENTGGGSGALAKVSDVPEGGALSVEDADGNELLLTQASAGTIVALSAICTHQGCTVKGDGGELLCPCHGSVFDLSGANVSGPARKPLSEVDVHVVDGEVLAGKT
ncbi:Rieske (2Fe-2S) protein [Modestobacter sp. VKM Ac-2983]|uniref:QcrA and Rieske domain-containing protein n=1 Tax=Modestobacter sp. VKM Ac-2983 TaxID=3004137 RepID=UPI0022ABA5CD|nr:Rieske (2Fe-2S) protein [Modestobacter sp. VKM Ac-2983]MCZ2805721.1 Rieske (2Fe-2S) protein [Modestobacter sp. VKM Ac-2983]